MAERPELPRGIGDGGEHACGHAEQFEQGRVPCGAAELGSRRCRRIGGEPGPQPVGQERVDRPHPERPALEGSLNGRVVFEQPCELARREVRVERHAAARPYFLCLPAGSSRSSTSWERLSCHVTIGVSGRPVVASQASTDSPWWSSPHAVTGPSALARSSPTASTTAVSTSVASCSTQPDCG